MLILKDSAVENLTFRMDDQDGNAKTGLSPTVTISKNGAGYVTPAGAVSEVGSGLYMVAAHATDSNTLGSIDLLALDPAAIPLGFQNGGNGPWQVVSANPRTDIAQTGDSFTRIGANGASLTSLATATSITTLQFDTDDIQTRLPAALTANGNMKSSLVEILTTALTETAGLLAGGFKKFFNVAAPTGTVNSLPDAVPGAAGALGVLDANLNLPADVKRWLTVAPAALTTNGYVQAMLLRWLTDNAGGTPDALSSGKMPADLKMWLAVAPLALSSQEVQAIVSAYASGQAPLQPTVAGRTLDVAATGEAGLDFDNIKQATGATTLTNIRLPNVTLTDTVTTYTGNTPQTGDNFARTGAPAGASVSADIAAAKADTAAIKLKTDLIPASPAAVGSAMTLTAAYDAAKTASQAGDAMALTSGERNSVADAYLDRANAIETGLTPRQFQRLMKAVIAGVAVESPAGTYTMKRSDGTTTAVTVIHDTTGNRTSVTIGTL